MPARPARPTDEVAAVRSTTLANGVTVVTELMPGALSSACGVWIHVGSRDETPDEAGASHFLEHLLFKGTDERGAVEIAESIDAVGGDINAFTTKEYTAFHTRTLAEDTELGLGLLCDIVTAPALRPDDVECERRVILEEILMHHDEPEEMVHDIAQEAVFSGHPLGRDPLGTAASIGRLGADDIRSFMDTHYATSRVVVAAAGLVDHDEVVEITASRLHRPRRRAAIDRTEMTPRSGIATVKAEDTEQAHLVLASPAFGYHDRDRFALGVVDHVLGGGPSSRLFIEIRERRGLSYSVYSFRAMYSDSGFFGIATSTGPDHVPEVLELIDAELNRLARDGISDQELRRAKSSLRGATALGLEDPGSRMSRIARSRLLYGKVTPVSEVLARTEKVTRRDCQRVIERALCSARSLAVVGPFDEHAFDGHPILGV